MRRTQMVIPPADRAKYWLGAGTHVVATTQAKGSKKKAAQIQSKSRKGPGRPAKAQQNKTNILDDVEPPVDLPPNQMTTFPVVITTYEMIIRDTAELGMYKWGFIVVDEGHRLKNMECRLIRELKSLNADSRMVLTGTPLHVSVYLPPYHICANVDLQNNLAELWSLLNFVLPDVFADLDTFQEW
jgi:ATP-dependent DNA helicase